MFVTPLDDFDEDIYSFMTTKAAQEAVVSIVSLSALLHSYNNFACFTLSLVKEIASGNSVNSIK
jgi:hypothetical protein